MANTGVYTIKVEDLKDMVDELIKDEIEYVDIGIIEAHEFDGENYPTSISFNAYDGTGGGVDFGDIETCEVDAFYKCSKTNCVHNLFTSSEVLGGDWKSAPC